MKLAGRVIAKELLKPLDLRPYTAQEVTLKKIPETFNELQADHLIWYVTYGLPKSHSLQVVELQPSAWVQKHQLVPVFCDLLDDLAVNGLGDSLVRLCEQRHSLQLPLREWADYLVNRTLH